MNYIEVRHDSAYSFRYRSPESRAFRCEPVALIAAGKFDPASALVQNSNAVSPAEFVIDPPTLINLGFEWFIEGDANRSASVDVSYRKKGEGETQWKKALPLLRLQNEEIFQGDRLHVISPNMFAGSILDLDPG